MHMRTTLLGLAASAALVTMPATASAQVITLRAQLHGGNENPAVVSGAHGNATVVIDRAAGTIQYTVNIYNLPTGVVASHIHVGSAQVNGPVILDFRVVSGTSNDFQLSGTLTAAELRANAQFGINSFEDAIFAIASGVTYVNVHSQANPGGEIRGQLCPESAAANTYNAVAVCTATK
jgi:hypothetical protein